MFRRLYIVPQCKDMIEELRKYKYPKPKKKIPIVYDHEFDPMFPGQKYGGVRKKGGDE